MKRTDALHTMLPCDRYTPYSLAKKLGARAVLESATNDNGRGRYSVILVDQAFRVVQEDDGPAFIIEGKRKKAAFKNNVRTVPYRNGVTFEKDILDVLEYVANQNKLEFGEMPLPAAGIGYLGYEFCARCDMIQLAEQTDPLDVPEAMFIVGHLYVIFDHVTQQLHLFALNYNEHEINLEAAMDDLQKKITNMDFSYLEPEPELEPCRIVTNMVQSAVDYISAVNQIKHEIVEGNLLQAVPSRRVLIESKMTALSLYRRLRSENPSPYLFYLDFDNFQLVGASPESLVRLSHKTAQIHPIAGTRRRGKDRDEDLALEEELLADEKERAEHIMLVDLARNDLGRVCKTGSVTAPQLMTIERFSHVMHIVSDVEGTIAEKTKPLDVLRSAFPAGTVSGAPKIKAIEIVSGLEKVKRRFYAGAVGYIKHNSDFDFCIALRCALKKDGVWALQAGGGIVSDSNPERELEETNEKMGALVKVFTGKNSLM